MILSAIVSPIYFNAQESTQAFLDAVVPLTIFVGIMALLFFGLSKCPTPYNDKDSARRFINDKMNLEGYKVGEGLVTPPQKSKKNKKTKARGK